MDNNLGKGDFVILNLLKKLIFHFLYVTNLKRKLIATFFIIIIIPIFVLGIFITSNLYETTFYDKIKSSNTSVRQIGENIASGLSKQTGVIRSLLSDTSFIGYLDFQYEDDFLALTDYMDKIRPVISRLTTDGQDLTIKVFSGNNTIGFSGELNNHLKVLQNQAWYKKPEKHSDAISWTSLCKLHNSDDSNYIGCYRTLYDFTKDGNILAVISVFLNEISLYSLISEERSGGNIVFLFDSTGKVVTTTERGLLGKGSGEIFLNKDHSIIGFKSGTIVKYNDVNYLYSVTDISRTLENINGWKVVYLTPADRILKEIKMIWLNSILLSILSIILSLIIITSVSASINRRIASLINKMKKVFNGDLSVYLNVDGSDEISVLQSDFNTMVDKLNTLIHEVYESKIKLQGDEIVKQKIEIRRRNAEIKALQRQINPHYLINTLESIRMNLVLKGDIETAGIIKKLAATFRILVYDNKRMHRVRDEINFIRMYMDIQNYRFKDRIRIEYAVSPGVEDKYIPKLIIQPLVENAVCHGIEIKDGGGNIAINVSELDNAIFVAVSDDGVGISPRKLGQIINTLDSEVNDEIDIDYTMSVALANIHHRIRLEFGEPYGLQVFSEKGKGTTVRLLIPLDCMVQ